MKLLLAGPGTGKTTKIKEMLTSHSNLDRVLVLSFTNATVQDLIQSFAEDGIDITDRNCQTLHKYALRLNHQKNLHILNSVEEDCLGFYSKKFNIAFRDLCRVLGCITFDQMIVQTTAYIQSNPAYLNDLIGEIDLLIVDEYQDFNQTERGLISLISQNANDSIILGDDDQCIYDFKDADADGIMQLYNDSDVENLDHHNVCYRCPDCVIDASTSLIQNNQRRVAKNWIKNGKEGQLTFCQFRTRDEEADYIIKEIASIKSNDPNSSIMVLSSVGFALDIIHDQLIEKNIEFANLCSQKIDLESLKKLWEVRAILGSKKILNLLFLIFPGIKGSKKLLAALATKMGDTLSVETIVDFIENNKLIDFDLLESIKKGRSLQDLVNESQYLFLAEHLNESKLESDLEKISQLITEPVSFDQNGINLLSIHKSKGLQAENVFIVGAVEGILPNVLRGLDSIEMQRRLLFVGMSRSKSKLYITSAIEWDGKYVNKSDKAQFKFDFRSRKYLGRASTFISELNLPQ